MNVQRVGCCIHILFLLLCFLLFPRYHLKDVIVGKIYFLLVRIKIKHMEIDIIKRETTGTGPNVYHENDTIAKYEIMDGAPVRGKPCGPPPPHLPSQPLHRILEGPEGLAC